MDDIMYLSTEEKQSFSLGYEADFVEKVVAELNKKVDKVDGMGLSEKSFTKEEKEKLAGLKNYDDATLKEQINSIIPQLVFESYSEAVDYFFENPDIKKGIMVSIASDVPGSGRYNLYYFGGVVTTYPGGYTGVLLNEIRPTEAEIIYDKVVKIAEYNSDSETKYPSVKAVVDYVAENSGKANVITSITDTLVLEDRQDAQLGELSALILAMPEEVNTTYSSAFSFISGETATQLTYSTTPILWRGDDCDSDGAFVPEANTMYEVSVKYINTNPESNEPVIVARVGAI